jgi:hypothetical protein
MEVALALLMKWSGALLCFGALAVGACSHEPPASSRAAASATEVPASNPPQQVTPADRTTPDVQIEMKNVRLHLADGIVLDVSHLRGVMVPRTPGRPPVFDDQRSYVLHVLTASIAMDVGSLQTLLNSHVLGYEGAPLKDLHVTTEPERLVIQGKLHKGVDIPFSTKASVGTTADGNLQLHSESMKAAGIPAKGLMKLFGLELDDVMDLKRRRGVDVRDNDIVIAPGQVLPPPEIRGRLTRVAIAGQRLVQTFGGSDPGRALRVPAPDARNYIYFGTGSIRFGKLTMTDADLQLIDLDPRDPFEFDPARYNIQLVAGYSKNTPQKGLKTFMPDINDVARGANAGQRGARRGAGAGGP